MELEEAIKKYGISVPSDKEFYSKEYKEYFKGKRNQDKEFFEIYRPFQEMYTKSFYTTFYQEQDKNELSVENSEAVVLGGQTGAGKSALVHVAKEEFNKEGKQIFLIDDDMYRMFYPNAHEILEECPEYFTKITAIGSGSVTPKILKYASDKGLNFIFDGTLKNPRIIQTAMTWKNYKVNWKIMATSKMESLLSIFERNEELRKIGKGRMITVEAHDETYSGLEPTVLQLESLEDIGRIQVYGRGDKYFEPQLQYDSMKQGRYPTALTALVQTRRMDQERCKRTNVEERISKLRNTDIPLNEGEKEALDALEKSIKMEIER